MGTITQRPKYYFILSFPAVSIRQIYGHKARNFEVSKALFTAFSGRIRRSTGASKPRQNYFHPSMKKASSSCKYQDEI
jgi:hypothetical protein